MCNHITYFSVIEIESNTNIGGKGLLGLSVPDRVHDGEEEIATHREGMEAGTSGCWSY